MKYRPGVHPWSGNRNTDCPLAAVTATLAIVRRLLERAACQRVRLLRRAARSCGIRAGNSYLPAAGVLGSGGATRSGTASRGSTRHAAQRPTHGSEARRPRAPVTKQGPPAAPSLQQGRVEQVADRASFLLNKMRKRNL